MIWGKSKSFVSKTYESVKNESAMMNLNFKWTTKERWIFPLDSSIKESDGPIMYTFVNTELLSGAHLFEGRITKVISRQLKPGVTKLKLI